MRSNPMRNFVLIIVLLVWMVPFANALQVKALKDNQSVSAKISARELTRIFVMNDRIQSVRGIEGAYEITKDEVQGYIYIKPSPFFQAKSFNIFITTEQGHTYTLLLNPLDIPAENIALKSLTSSKLLAARWEMSSDYEKTLIHLIHSMTNEQNPEGYAVINLGKTKPRLFTSGLSKQLLTLYRGNHLQGEVWKIKNMRRKLISLSPQQFYQTGTRAIALEDETLSSGEETILYRVMNYV